jgi:uncharacterized SAM-binding protein YcdF (DUF218 family)
MFFFLSKVLTVVTVPSYLLFLIALIGVALLLTRYRTAGLRLLVANVLIRAVIWLLPIGAALTVPLETRFPLWTPAQGAPTGMIVLGGIINPALSAEHGQIAINGSAERLTAAVALSREYPNARIVFSGGNPSIFGGRAEADFAVRFFEQLGVSRDRVKIEAQSRDTAEEAVYCKGLIGPKPGERWLLITSAMHMPRAVGVFRQAGFLIVPYPVDYQNVGWPSVWAFGSGSMGGTDAAVHEWLGLLAYWITGRIPAFFPAP